MNKQTFSVADSVIRRDPATSWFEIHQYDDKKAITVANIAEEEWFPDTLGQHKSPLIIAQNSLDMSSTRC
jgi:hypothetical protein